MLQTLGGIGGGERGTREAQSINKRGKITATRVSCIHGHIQGLSLKSMPIVLGDGFDRGCARKKGIQDDFKVSCWRKQEFHGGNYIKNTGSMSQHHTHTHVLLKSS